MRVLLIDVNGKNSSTGQIVYDLYTYLNNHNDEAAICYGRGENIKGKNIFKFGLNWETYIHASLTRITGFTGCFSFFSTRRLICFIKSFNPDVVHLHELHAYFVNIQSLLKYLAKNDIKVVHTLHSEFSYTGKCGHSVDCEKWKTQCEKCPRLHAYIGTLFFDHTSYMYSQKKKLFLQLNELYLTAPSKWLYDRIGDSFLGGFPRFLVNNGVDTNIFKPMDTVSLINKYSIKPEEKVFLALAPNLLSIAKGGKFVMDIANDMKEDNVRFILVGVDGETERIEGNMVICGRIMDKTILAQYYSLADAFLICSRRENYPTTCLEAQACGTPVYGFNTGGTKETLINQDMDTLVEYGDILALESKLKDVKKKSLDSVNELRRLAVDKFDKEKALEYYYKLYKD